MTTSQLTANSKIGGLDDRSAELVHDLLKSMCLEGSCYEFAIALHNGTDLPMVGLWSPTTCDDNGKVGTWRHAAVRLPDGDYFDARGRVRPDEFGTPFGEPLPWKIHDISETDLLAVRRVPTARTGTIAKLAQALWPDLPWKPSSYQSRVAAFLSDLEALSNRHQVWIISSVPSLRPVLTEGDGDEAGYEARLTDDGLGVVFDRSFGR